MTIFFHLHPLAKSSPVECPEYMCTGVLPEFDRLRTSLRLVLRSILYNILLYYILLYYIISYYTILYYIILYYVILYYIILYYIILYYIIIFLLTFSFIPQ